MLNKTMYMRMQPNERHDNPSHRVEHRYDPNQCEGWINDDGSRRGVYCFEHECWPMPGENEYTLEEILDSLIPKDGKIIAK